MSITTDAKITEAISDRAWEAIRGGYDLRAHVAPDVIGRRTDDVELAKDFLSHGLKGFVLKSHCIPPAEQAEVARRVIPGIEVHGAITLNHSVGDLNPVA